MFQQSSSFKFTPYPLHPRASSARPQKFPKNTRHSHEPPLAQQTHSPLKNQNNTLKNAETPHSNQREKKKTSRHTARNMEGNQPKPHQLLTHTTNPENHRPETPQLPHLHTSPSRPLQKEPTHFPHTPETISPLHELHQHPPPHNPRQPTKTSTSLPFTPLYSLLHPP
ncbi:hypothetical protein M758_1G080700 [Ceratodon purpureus]|nr:hypothetical protein M758_1G080700 [Ceratodon purpureus]